MSSKNEAVSDEDNKEENKEFQERTGMIKNSIWHPISDQVEKLMEHRKRNLGDNCAYLYPKIGLWLIPNHIA